MTSSGACLSTTAEDLTACRRLSPEGREIDNLLASSGDYR